MKKPLNFNLTEEHLQVIGGALGDVPYRIAAPVIAELERQIAEQQVDPAEAASKPNAKDEIKT